MADSDCRSKRVNRPPSNSPPRAKNIPHSHVPFHITPDENSMQDNVLVNSDEDALLNTRETTAYSLITGAFLRLCWCNVMRFMVMWCDMMCYDVLWSDVILCTVKKIILQEKIRWRESCCLFIWLDDVLNEQEIILTIAEWLQHTAHTDHTVCAVQQ